VVHSYPEPAKQVQQNTFKWNIDGFSILMGGVKDGPTQECLRSWAINGVTTRLSALLKFELFTLMHTAVPVTRGWWIDLSTIS
jgi:hypothetical protein